MAIASYSINADLAERFRDFVAKSVIKGNKAALAGLTAAMLLISATDAAQAADVPAAGAAGASDAAAAVENSDAQFRTLFDTWKKLDGPEPTAISVPSMEPVDKVVFTSHFGVRSDPFRGTAAMHAGVDIPGAIGTPIYATADGVISHAGRQGGYGNLVQINHGRGLETRYGHLSKILVADNTKVHRGQLIGLMGSTGRSTGSHLHYEVRMDGRAVNPVPFLQSGEYVATVQPLGGVGGPTN
jgi:murein DD-endopeptidase MepM/ murein hydrolase activator NlpD